MKLIPIGGSPGDIRWRAEPEAGEEINPVEIRRIFFRLCPGYSIDIQDMLNGQYVMRFPDGINPTLRSSLYASILASGHVTALADARA